MLFSDVKLIVWDLDDTLWQGSPAYRMPVDTPVVKMLRDAANGVTGMHEEPFTLSGGTYANRLPNAYVFDTNANLAPKDFPKGHGSAHGVDESVSLERLQRAMRIYARALLRLNELDW
jgi:succinyl-diaminopimelate desuccinylase